MIAQLAEMAYRKAGQMFFCVQKDARSVTFSYRRARFAAAALAQQLAKRGYGRGTTLACNLYNGAEIVILGGGVRRLHVGAAESASFLRRAQAAHRGAGKRHGRSRHRRIGAVCG